MEKTGRPGATPAHRCRRCPPAIAGLVGGVSSLSLSSDSRDRVPCLQRRAGRRRCVRSAPCVPAHVPPRLPAPVASQGRARRARGRGGPPPLPPNPASRPPAARSPRTDGPVAQHVPNVSARTAHGRPDVRAGAERAEAGGAARGARRPRRALQPHVRLKIARVGKQQHCAGQARAVVLYGEPQREGLSGVRTGRQQQR